MLHAAQPSARRHQPHKILIFESTCLIAALQTFNGSMRPVEALQEKGLYDRIVIPDIIFYELTAILPSSIPEMLQKFGAAKDDAALNDIIKSYVRASPRTGNAKGTGMIARQLEELLHYVAMHPDTIVATDVGKAYCDSIKADHLLLGRSIPEEHKPLLDHYTPSRRDAMDLLGEQFHSDNLRVHVMDLFKMGFIEEGEYDKRMAREETPGSLKRRFITLGDFVSVGAKRGFISENDASAMLNSGNKNEPLTIGHFKDFYKIMPKKEGGYHNIDEAAVVDRMSMSHYLFGGIIPLEELVPIARWLGYSISDESVFADNKKKIADELHQQGFYEHTLTKGDIRRLSDHYKDDPRFDRLREILNIGVIAQKHSERFGRHCKTPSGMEEKTRELLASQVGVPYEKALAEALVAGTISFAEFFRIADMSGAIRNSTQRINPQNTSFSTMNNDIVLQYEDNPEEAVIKIKKSGFHARTGYTELPIFNDKIVDISAANGDVEKYLQFSVRELIAKAQEAYAGSEGSKYYRVFDAMLHHAANDSAPRLHEAALKVLGIDRLIQIEKDFSNRHYRRWNKQEKQPAFTSVLATIHVRRRVASKHLGEIATLETCQKLLEGGQYSPDNTVIRIANHDHSIVQENGGTLHLATDTIRQRPDHKQAIDGLQEFLRRPDVAGAIYMHKPDPKKIIDPIIDEMEKVQHGDASGHEGADRDWLAFLRRWQQRPGSSRSASLG